MLTQCYYCRNQSISEQRFSLSQQKPDSDATPSGTTDNTTKKRAKLVYQKMSIDEEPVSLDQSLHDLPPDQQTSHDPSPDQQTSHDLSDQQTSHDLPPDQQTSHDLPLDQQKSHDPSPDHQTSHDPLPDQQTSHEQLPLNQQTSHDPSPDQQISHEQFPDGQTQDQISNDPESQDLSLDHQKLQALDSRSPSFMSLQNEGLTVQSSKQRKAVVLEQPLLEEAKVIEESNITLEEMKEADELSSQIKEETDAPPEILHKEADIEKSKTPLGEIKEEDPSSHGKEETDTASEFLRVPSTSQQQQRSMSVPSYPPQLKSILRRSNAPKSLSLDIHNMDDVDEDSSNKRPPLVHKMSVSYNYIA